MQMDQLQAFLYVGSSLLPLLIFLLLVLHHLIVERAKKINFPLHINRSLSNNYLQEEFSNTKTAFALPQIESSSLLILPSIPQSPASSSKKLTDQGRSKQRSNRKKNFLVGCESGLSCYKAINSTMKAHDGYARCTTEVSKRFHEFLKRPRRRLTFKPTVLTPIIEGVQY